MKKEHKVHQVHVEKQVIWETLECKVYLVEMELMVSDTIVVQLPAKSSSLTADVLLAADKQSRVIPSPILHMKPYNITLLIRS